MCIVINLLLCTNKSSLLRKARKEIKMEKTKVYSRTEMREMMMNTSEYFFMNESGDFVGTLEMKAEARAGMLRLFLRLSDNRKIITPVFWWQRYLGFYEMEIGTKLKLSYRESGQNKIFLQSAEILEKDS